MIAPPVEIRKRVGKEYELCDLNTIMDIESYVMANAPDMKSVRREDKGETVLFHFAGTITNEASRAYGREWFNTLTVDRKNLDNPRLDMKGIIVRDIERYTSIFGVQ